ALVPCLGLGQERPPVFGEQLIEDRLLRSMARVRAFGRCRGRAPGDREGTGSSHPRLSGGALRAFRASRAVASPRAPARSRDSAATRRPRAFPRLKVAGLPSVF